MKVGATLDGLGILCAVLATLLAGIFAEALTNISHGWDPGVGVWCWIVLAVLSALLPFLGMVVRRRTAYMELSALPEIGRDLEDLVGAHLSRQESEDPIGTALANLEEYCTETRNAVASALGVPVKQLGCDLMVALDSEAAVAELAKVVGKPIENPFPPREGESVGRDGLVDADVSTYLAVCAGAETVSPIFLRVAKQRRKTLPGAPMALVAESKNGLWFDHIDDVADIDTEKFSDAAAPEVRREVEAYFTKELPDVRSVLSVGLRSGEEAYGVLNLTSSKKDLFSKSRKPDQYIIEGLLRPRLPLLVDLARPIVVRLRGT